MSFLFFPVFDHCSVDASILHRDSFLESILLDFHLKCQYTWKYSQFHLWVFNLTFYNIRNKPIYSTFVSHISKYLDTYIKGLCKTTLRIIKLHSVPQHTLTNIYRVQKNVS